MWCYEYPDYLAHHGVKGMKWGVRKKSYSSSYKYRTKRFKQGYNFQNITKDNRARKLSNNAALYVSYTPKDNKTYRNMYWWFGDQPVKNTITAQKNIKIAGVNASTNMFVRMCAKNGKKVAGDLGDTRYDLSSQKTLRAKAKGVQWIQNEGYQNFVRQYTEGLTDTHKSFNASLSKKKYDGIYDVYDINEGYSQSPLIITKAEDSVKVTKSQRYEYD